MLKACTYSREAETSMRRKFALAVAGHCADGSGE